MTNEEIAETVKSVRLWIEQHEKRSKAHCIILGLLAIPSGVVFGVASSAIFGLSVPMTWALAAGYIIFILYLLYAF